MSGFADELGKLAAQALHQKELAYEREKASLGAKMWGEWAGRVGIREKAKDAASKGHTYFEFKFDAKQYGFKEFKPKKDDIIANLPEPLKLEWGFKKLRVGAGSGYPEYLEFECSLIFGDEADKHLATIKRKADATTDAPASRRVKAEVKAEPR
jgi:hypothetical protein